MGFFEFYPEKKEDGTPIGFRIFAKGLAHRKTLLVEFKDGYERLVSTYRVPTENGTIKKFFSLRQEDVENPTVCACMTMQPGSVFTHGDTGVVCGGGGDAGEIYGAWIIVRYE